METIKNILSNLVGNAFECCNYDKLFGEVSNSDRPDLSHFQCNGALAAAKKYKKNPFIIAEEVCNYFVDADTIIESIQAIRPGFINIKIKNTFLIEYINDMFEDYKFANIHKSEPKNIIIDYGGANVAKPLHIGHLRSAIIGESLKRCGKFLGHNVIGDVHLGDWGLQMGIVINEIRNRYPDLPYFDDNFQGEYPDKAPISIDDLEELYPYASKIAKENPDVMELARKATFDLQNGKPGFIKLWQQILNISTEDLKKNYDNLNVKFDLWLGESDSQVYVKDMIEYLKKIGLAYESEGALIVDVFEPEDSVDVPPFIVTKSDGSVLYSTTDLATIIMRKKVYKADEILYVVDNRQETHFKQVFRCAYKSQIADEKLKLHFVGFGTMNGKDGKPYKTRDGGVMKLSDLISEVKTKARQKMNESSGMSIDKFDENEIAGIVDKIGIASLKFADLSNYRSKNYVFDIDMFSSFEGKTGPYILFNVVRIKSILRKVKEQNIEKSDYFSIFSDIERELLLAITEFNECVVKAFNDKAPNILCELVYKIASLYSKFYNSNIILKETDKLKQQSWINLSEKTLYVMEILLDLLGIESPERM